MAECENCGHPDGPALWGPHVSRSVMVTAMHLAMADLLRGREPVAQPVAYTPCHPGCTHGGPIRLRQHGEADWEEWGPEKTQPTLAATYKFAIVQASWRIIERRRLPTGQRLLCQRCYVGALCSSA